MRPAAWAALAVVALLGAVAAGALAFTRFDDAGPVVEGSEEARRQEERLYADARWSAVWGVAAAFLLLGAAACGQQAARGRRGRDGPAP